MAPILPLILAIGAAMIAVTAAAVWYQNKQKAEAEAAGVETDRQMFDLANSSKNRDSSTLYTW